jgi:hypothetical protein
LALIVVGSDPFQSVVGHGRGCGRGIGGAVEKIIVGRRGRLADAWWCGAPVVLGRCGGMCAAPAALCASTGVAHRLQ